MSATEERWNQLSTAVAGAALCTIPADNRRQGSQYGHEWLAGSTCQPANDDELVYLALGGDSSAFGKLVVRHYNMCLRRAFFIVRNHGDAEDQVQNAFSKAFQRLVQYRRDGTFSAWLGRIVENQCLMHIREQRKSRFVYLDESRDSNIKLELIDSLENPEDGLGDEQVITMIRREISRIPPLLRSVMLLRDVQQLPMPEVALRLGLSVPAAKSRLMRARAELRWRVTRHCGRMGCVTLTRRSQYGQTAWCRAS